MSSQENIVTAGVPQDSILDSTLFLIHILMMFFVILLSMLIRLISTLSILSLRRTGVGF